MFLMIIPSRHDLAFGAQILRREPCNGKTHMPSFFVPLSEQDGVNILALFGEEPLYLAHS